MARWLGSTCGFVLLASHAMVWPAEVQVTVVNAKSQPLKDAVVFLESPLARTSSKPMQGVAISQKDKAFMPAVTVVTVGTAVNFPNLDTVRHHVYSFSPAKVFEIKLYVGTPTQPVVFDKPGIAVLGCNIHDHMTAWTVIVETPWHGKTDAQGRLVLDRLPPGRYNLRAWHANLPVGDAPLMQPLSVNERGITRAHIQIASVGEP